MSEFTVDTDSLQAIEKLLLTCAGELANAPAEVRGGTPSTENATLYSDEDVKDCVNGAWWGLADTNAGLALVLNEYSASIDGSAEVVAKLAKLLKRAIEHYERVDQAAATAAGGPR